jgi:hypothetical protein
MTVYLNEWIHDWQCAQHVTRLQENTTHINYDGAYAPVAAMRASRSAAVVQVMLVPALLTRGRAAQVVPPAHWVKTNFPPTH